MKEREMRSNPLQLPYLDVETLKRATVVEILPSGELVVRLEDAAGQTRMCDFLETSLTDRPVLREGDRVLALTPENPEEKGCVLGKIGTYRKPDRKRVVLEAGEELIVRCGEGSITIRKSGKVLVKGLEIVSHAKGANRIRGGSIQLN